MADVQTTTRHWWDDAAETSKVWKAKQSRDVQAMDLLDRTDLYYAEACQ